MNLYLVNLLRDWLGEQHSMYIHPRFEDRDETRVLVVDCWPANAAAYVKDGNFERFYVRSGAATSELSASQTEDYIA